MAIYALGDWEPAIAADAYIHPEAVVIGRVRIGSQSSIWPGAVLRGDSNEISVGVESNIQDGVVIHCSAQWSTQIGARVTVGHSAHIEGAHVGEGALIGAGAILLSGAVVEPHALVGAGALVPGGMRIPTGARALGVPAKITLDVVPMWPGASNVETYLDLARLYRATLKRLD